MDNGHESVRLSPPPPPPHLGHFMDRSRRPSERSHPQQSGALLSFTQYTCHIDFPQLI